MERRHRAGLGIMLYCIFISVLLVLMNLFYPLEVSETAKALLPIFDIIFFCIGFGLLVT